MYTKMANKEQYEGSQEWLDDISRLDQNKEVMCSKPILTMENYKDGSPILTMKNCEGHAVLTMKTCKDGTPILKMKKCEEPILTMKNCKEEKEDEDFYGFHRLDDPYRYAGEKVYLYRVLRVDECIDHGIFCQDKDSNRTVAQHIASGSKYKSKFISTTLSLDVAKLWAYFDMKTRTARDEPLRIVKIDIQVLAGTKYEKKCINLCNDNVRNHFLKGATHRNWAKSSKEVLFVEEIPKYVTIADKVNTSTHYYEQVIFFLQSSLPRQMTTQYIPVVFFFQQLVLPPPMITVYVPIWYNVVPKVVFLVHYTSNLVYMYELPKTFWEIDASRPSTPPPKKEKKTQENVLVTMMSSMNLK